MKKDFLENAGYMFLALLYGTGRLTVLLLRAVAGLCVIALPILAAAYLLKHLM